MSNDDTNDVPEPNPMDQLFDAQAAGRMARIGDLVTGTIVKITGEAVFVSYGAKSEGWVSLAELRDDAGGLLLDVGGSADFVVIETKGSVHLSYRDAQAGRAKVALRDAFQEGISVRGKVVSTNKGGFEVRIQGVRAFCPSSQIAERQGTDPQSVVGQEFDFRITEWDDAKGPVVSRRVLLEADRGRAREAVANTFAVGDVLQGKVTQLRDFGAFVDLGGVEGLIHVSELGRTRVAHPSEKVKVGDAVEVVVVKLEPEKNRIALRLQDGAGVVDPWAEFVKQTPPGTAMKGTVARLQTFGAFVTVAEGVDGLLHVSAISADKRIAHPGDVLKVGESIDVVVESIDLQKNHISLVSAEVFARRGGPAVNIEVGAVVKGRVTKIEKFGLFVEIGPRTSGLLPMQEIDVERGGDVAGTYPIGCEIEVKVIEIEEPKEKGDRRRIRLSRKALKGESEADDFRQYRQREQVVPERQGVTLGDLFAQQLKRR